MVLDSVAGKGTTVHVFLPRWYEPDPTEEVDITNAVTLAGLDNPPAADDGLQVVVIDDEPGVRRIVTKLLQACGYVVTAFESPLEFLEKTDDGPHYDALVTDINMPGMSGVDLVRKLERSGRVRPTLFISGYFADDLDLQEFEVDCYGFLEKPLGKKTLNEALQDCIRRYRDFRDGLEAPQF